MASLALAWFVLGTALNTFVAFNSGKRIDIVVCSGAGVKTVSVVDHISDDSVSVLKHCSNAPIYVLITVPGTPVNLDFAVPRTVAVWQYKPSSHMTWLSVQDSRPPPGRAPPALPLA